MSAIVQMRGNTSVLVWTVRMIMDADILNDRVDLDLNRPCRRAGETG